MEYMEAAPPPALAGIVRCFWCLTGDGPDRDAPADLAYPDGSPELIVNFGQPFEHLVRGRAPRRQPLAFLVGQITRPMAVRPTGRVHIVAARFESHGASVLHRPMQPLTDRWKEITRLGADPVAALRRRLGAAPSLDAAIAAIAVAIDHARRSAPLDVRVADAVAAIRSSTGAVSAEQLARDAGLTPRTLQRLFAQQVGITPKLLARIVRFQRVFAAWRDEPASLARVAAACGYYDQPHLVRDFRAFAGDAPARALASMPEFTRFFTALSPSSG